MIDLQNLKPGTLVHYQRDGCRTETSLWITLDQTDDKYLRLFLVSTSYQITVDVIEYSIQKINYRDWNIVHNGQREII